MDNDKLIARKLRENWEGQAFTLSELTPAFLNKLRDLVKAKVKDGDLSADDWTSAVKQARAYAGGKGKAAKSKRPKEDDMPDDGMMDKKKEAREESLTDKIRKVEAAIYAKFKTAQGYSQYYSREVYDTYAIVCENDTNKYYRVPWAVNVKGDIEFGDFTEVEEEYVPVNMADLCARGGQFRFFYELSEFAEPPEWIPFLPTPGEFKHPKYGTIKITSDRNKNFIANFEAGVYQKKLPINAEHKDSEDGAFGWIVGMRQNDDGSVDAKASWTDLGTEAIKNERFAYISPEWMDKYKKNDGTKHEDVALGAALTTRPFFKEDALRPLIASEAGWKVVERKSLQGNGVCNIFCTELEQTRMAEPTKCAMPGCDEDAMSGSKYCEMHAKEKEMAEPKEDSKEFAEKITALEGQVKTLTDSLTAKDTELKTANEKVKASEDRITALEKSARKKRFTDIATKDFTGKIEDHVATMEFFADHDEKGEESDQLKKYIETQTAVANQLKASDTFRELGSESAGDGQSPQGKLDALAKKRMSDDPKLTYAQAYSQVMDTPEGRELYGQHRKGVN